MPAFVMSDFLAAFAAFLVQPQVVVVLALWAVFCAWGWLLREDDACSRR